MDRKPTQANLILLITAAIWGGGFVAQRLGMELMGPFIFNGFRFLVGSLTIVPVLILRRKNVKAASATWKQTIGIGAAASLFLFWGATFQQLGLVSTTAGKAGFITGLYVIIVPLLGMLWGDQAGRTTWIGAGLAVIGLYLLSAVQGLRIARGDGYVILGTLFWAGHVQFLARFSPQVDPLRLSFVQSLLTALFSFGVGLVWEPFVWNDICQTIGPIVYGGAVSIGIAYTLQIIGQRLARPTPAAIILSLESVFAAWWGWLLLGETLTPRGLVGSLLMLSGMVVSQVKVRQHSG